MPQPPVQFFPQEPLHPEPQPPEQLKQPEHPLQEEEQLPPQPEQPLQELEQLAPQPEQLPTHDPAHRPLQAPRQELCAPCMGSAANDYN